MSNPSYFPASLAEGEAFCNREAERKLLKEYMIGNQPTVVVAPRRYGKTSLIRQTLLETKSLAISIDLLLATNSLFIKKAIQDNVAKLLMQLLPKQKQAQQKIIDFIRKMHPKLTINMLGHSLELSTAQTEERSIVDLLLSLENAAKNVNKSVVVVFDEFQQLGEIKESHAIEAAIRHAVERSKYVTYLFSGSHRHLLTHMFTDRNRPLYHLCELMYLNRIKPYDYQKFIAKHFEQKWRVTINKLIVDEILILTGCHAFYVNALCRRLWSLEKPPTVPEVQTHWDEYVKAQSQWIIDDLDQLSPNQINVLAAVTYQPTVEVLSSAFAHKVKLSVSSIKMAIDFLMKHDFIYRDEKDYYRTLDPAIETYIKWTKYFEFAE